MLSFLKLTLAQLKELHLLIGFIFIITGGTLTKI